MKPLTIVVMPSLVSLLAESLRIEQEAKLNPDVSSEEDLVLGSQIVVSHDETLVRSNSMADVGYTHILLPGPPVVLALDDREAI